MSFPAPASPSPTAPARWDLWGTALSALCLVHCLALPLLVYALPTIYGWFGSSSSGAAWTSRHASLDLWLHGALLLLAVPIALNAFARGHRRHRRILPGLLGLGGLLALVLGLLGSGTLDLWHAPGVGEAHSHGAGGPVGWILGQTFTIVGGVLLIVGHTLNLRSTPKRCQDPTCCTPDPHRSSASKSGTAG